MDAVKTHKKKNRINSESKTSDVTTTTGLWGDCAADSRAGRAGWDNIMRYFLVLFVFLPVWTRVR